MKIMLGSEINLQLRYIIVFSFGMMYLRFIGIKNYEKCR